MKISVEKCLSLRSFSPSVLAAGKAGLQNRVRGISVLDAPNPEEAVKENGVPEQLVLTSFSGLSGKDSVKAEIAKTLADAGVAGIVVFDHGDNSSEALARTKEACEKAELPLILIPKENPVRYAEMIEEVMDEVRYGENFESNLIANTIFHLLNFEKHTSFPAALKEAAVSNDFQVVLLSHDFNPVLAVETRQKITIEQAVQKAKGRDVEKSGIYTFVDVDDVPTYWGPLTVNGEKYFLLIVDNDDNYSPSDISKLAEIIELAMGMWKYTPERDVRAEFVKALVRDNKSLAYSLKDEMNLDPSKLLGVFYARGISSKEAQEMITETEEKEGILVVRISDADETNAVVIEDPSRSDRTRTEQKMALLALFDRLKELDRSIRIFQATEINGIEGAGDAFHLINETWTFVESVFPFKRVFTKYELALVSNCINLQVQGGHLKKTYMDLLEPFKREMGENKAKQLLETLETFVLDAGMNSSKTSVFMGIHTNTVQYRLKRINEVLGAEITGNRVIPGLTMALALKRLERAVG
ncbi:MAG: PucR family transcriptional regulator [Eubacteriales bacterium]|nr:PucR family transcriptional regulator [Eubacteriales bacterium]